MAFQSLYRKYRPQRFDALVGQDAVTTALRNAVREGRVGHAYLFSGPRGTGKTTSARILAKALNCLELRPDGDPCDECVNCLAVSAGTFPDLTELDAASNNGVGAVRDLVEKVHFGLSATGKRKVYVVDEVHMLSTGASNALLKTLEEPPDHVVFILATTDPHKVLPTIRSRTQHFEFTLLADDELRAHLADIAAREHVDVAPEVIDLVVRQGAGSARDALSKLDMAFAVGLDHDAASLDTERVVQAFGGTGFERRVAVLQAIVDDDAAGALMAVQDALQGGIDPRELAEEILATARDAFVMAASGGRSEYHGTAAEASHLHELARAAGLGRCTRVIESLGDAIADMRGAGAPDPRLVLEVAVVRLARHDTATDISGLLERLAVLEARVQQLSSGAPVGPVAGSAAGPSDTPSARAPMPKRPTAPVAPAASEAAPAAETAPRGPRPALGAFANRGPAAPAAPAPPVPTPSESVAPAARSGPVELDDVVVAWSATLGSLNSATRAMVAHAQPVSVQRDSAGDIVVFGVPHDQFVAVRARFKNNADEIRAELARQLGVSVRFKLEEHDFGAPGALSGAPMRSDARADDLPDDVDLDEIDDTASAPAPPDTQSLLMRELGAQVVEENPRNA